MSRWSPRISAAASSVAPPPAGTEFALATSAQLDLYVATTGSDSNPGTSPAAPLATYGAAVRIINTYSLIGIGGQNAIIHMASGSYALDDVFDDTQLRGSIAVIGDGAGQPGDDGFTQLVASTPAIAGSGTQVIVTAGGFGVNTYRGKTIEVLTGAAAGDRRTLRSHTDTDLIPARNFSAAIAANDTFRIVEPAVDLTISGSTLVASGVGAPGSIFSTDLGTIDDVVPALYFVNIAIPSGAAAIRLHGSNVVFLGVERSGASCIIDNDGMLGFGADTVTGRVNIGPALGAVSATSWAGWGLAAINTSLAQNAGYCYGYVTAVSIQPQTGEMLLLGGSSITAGTPALQFVDSGTRVKVQAATAPDFLFEGTTGPIIQIGGTTGECALDLANADLVGTSGTLVLVQNPTARVNISSTATGSAPTGVGINASWGSRIAVRGAIGLTGNPAGPNDITVDNGVAFAAAGSLGAAGVSLVNAVDGSGIFRIS